MGFIVQSATLSNFNDSPVICNASYFKNAPMWGSDELHLTRVKGVYVYSAANTKVSGFVATGYEPIKYVAVPVWCCEASTASVSKMIDSGPIDIPLEPTGEDYKTSGVQFFIMTVTGVNAGDDITFIFEGWTRKTLTPVYDRPPTPLPVAVKSVRFWPKRMHEGPI